MIKLEHILFDIWLKDDHFIKFVEPLRSIIVDAAKQGGAHIIYEQWHQFEPWGVTGFLLLQESHISIHTWPEEENFAAIDIFPCGSMNNNLIINSIRENLKPAKENLLRVSRGSNR